MKKIGLFLIVLILIFVITGCDLETDKTENETTEKEKQVIVIDYNELGEYGEDIILNKDTDMPVTKRTYKLPAGDYVVTTDWEKLASFWIVKDEIEKDEGSAPYVEQLQYVGEAYFLTGGEDDFNGKAKKEVEITLKDDERILYTQKSVKLTFTEK